VTGLLITGCQAAIGLFRILEAPNGMRGSRGALVTD
jgi:hypothetical protein